MYKRTMLTDGDNGDGDNGDGGNGDLTPGAEIESFTPIIITADPADPTAGGALESIRY
jgi:hypothetical protein